VAKASAVPDMLETEILEGKAPSMAAAVREAAGGLLCYAPIARRDDYESVISHLVRRFDENTGSENFLRNQFTLRSGSPEWDAERQRFEAWVSALHGRASPPDWHRTREPRSTSPPTPPERSSPTSGTPTSRSLPTGSGSVVSLPRPTCRCVPLRRVLLQVGDGVTEEEATLALAAGHAPGVEVVPSANRPIPGADGLHDDQLWPCRPS